VDKSKEIKKLEELFEQSILVKKLCLEQGLVSITNIDKAAKKMGIKVFGFLGCFGGEVIHFCDEAFLVSSKNTGRIQEAHITAVHALMDYIEDHLLEEGYIHLYQ